MAKNKTTETAADVFGFIEKVPNEKRRTDSFALLGLFRAVTGFEPKIWGPTIIGFGKYHYRYKSGHEGEAPLAGFAPRKDALVIYIAPDFKDRDILLSQLGKHSSSKCCLYARKLEELNLPVLRRIIRNSMTEAKKMHAGETGL